MNKDDQVYLMHILECIEDVERYIQGERERFFEDDLVRNACLRQLQIMSESTQRVSEPLKQSMSEVNWRRLGAFRNVLVHDYLGNLDVEEIWGIIENRLPELKAVVVRVLRTLKGKI